VAGAEDYHADAAFAQSLRARGPDRL
jgi:hypothetical protein